jgi:hypothetical protein
MVGRNADTVSQSAITLVAVGLHINKKRKVNGANVVKMLLKGFHS